MVSLNKVTQHILRDINRRESDASTTVIPVSIFGPYVAPHIQSVRVVQGRMVLKVPDPAWRRVLEGDKDMLLEKVKPIAAGITAVELVP